MSPLSSVLKLKNYSLEFIVFICGAVVMVLELVGSRILAPYLGTSIYIWTSLIGIILGSLSLGYWWGGKIADRRPDYKTFSFILLLAAIATALIVIAKEPLLAIISKISDIRIGGILAATILFAPASVLLGMISPYAVKLKMNNIGTSGATVGNLYAISTVGSIAGTFLAGFFLISYFGNAILLVILAVTLCLMSIMASSRPIIGKLILICLIFTQVFTVAAQQTIWEKNGLLDFDTLYSRVIVKKTMFDGRPINYLITNPREIQSGSFADNPAELVFDYTKFYMLDRHFMPNFRSALMIGGGAYSYPKYFLYKYPDKTLDVVEIDPMFTKLAMQYFGLTENPRMKAIHDDGRTFLNHNINKYDVIYMDAFRSFYAVPFHLTTREAASQIYRSLTEDGVVMINTISAIDGDQGKFLRAEYKTYKAVFPYVYVFPINANSGSAVQNIMMVALKSKKSISFTSSDPTLQAYLSHLWTKEIPTDMPLLTDDYAPVDQYMMELM